MTEHCPLDSGRIDQQLTPLQARALLAMMMDCGPQKDPSLCSLIPAESDSRMRPAPQARADAAARLSGRCNLGQIAFFCVLVLILMLLGINHAHFNLAGIR